MAEETGSDRDQTLNEVMAAYVQASEAGEAPDRSDLLARHSEIAAELATFLDDYDRVNRLAGPLRQALGTAETDASPSRNGANRPPLVGSRLHYFGDYELTAEIARGGMGVVYRARQISLNRPVALKMILAGSLAGEADLQRFRNEAEAVANLDHPNIVPIYEVGVHEGQSYFSMKLIEGGSVAERLSEFASDPRAAARLLATVARAVHHAHQRGVLHRDLKPANILLDQQGQPHVSDFGLAKRVEAEVELTRSGAILGSPPYMAPEQTTGRRGAITTATDVYGLGAILYAMLAGRPPFKADSVLETIEQVRQCEPEPPSGINRRVDRDLQTVCLKCLNKDPLKRYALAFDLADDLDRWLAGVPIAARPVGKLERARLWCWRNPAVAALTILSGLLALATMVTLLVALIRIAKEQTATKAALRDAQARTRQAEAGRFWLLHGVTEPLKKLADPGMARDPDIAELRRQVIAEAIHAFQGFIDSQNDDAEARSQSVDFWIHIGLLHTAADDHPRAQEAYRRSIAFAERAALENPGHPGCFDQLGMALMHLGMDLWQQGLRPQAEPYLREAAARFKRSLELGPDDFFVLQHASWFLLFSPDIRFRDTRLGLPLAERVVALLEGKGRDRASFSGGLRPLFTLGLAHYRSCDWDATRAVLERSIALRNGGDAYEGFVLAMTLARQGHREEALRTFHAAWLWMKRNRYGDFELHFLLDEAAVLLGVPNPKAGIAEGPEVTPRDVSAESVTRGKNLDSARMITAPTESIPSAAALPNAFTRRPSKANRR